LRNGAVTGWEGEDRRDYNLAKRDGHFEQLERHLLDEILVFANLIP